MFLNRLPTTCKYSFLVLLVVVFAGCANAPQNNANAQIQLPNRGDGCLPDRTWLRPADGQILLTSGVVADAAKQKVVLLGELHDSSSHHLWQATMIAALAARGRDVIVGLEMLPASAQPVLDQWIAGELSESEFLKHSGWSEYWRFDPELYMPILRVARLYRIPVYGLNVDRALVNLVKTKGWENLSESEREGLQDPAPALESYQRMLAESFVLHAQHNKHENSDASANEMTDEQFSQLQQNQAFLRFVQGQLLWDAAMAQRINDILAKNSNAQVVGIMGSGHMMNAEGVPYQLRTSGTTELAVLLPWDKELPCEWITADLADAIYGISNTPAEAPDLTKPRLGIHIENHASGVIIKKIEPGGIGEAAGLQANDVIVVIAGRTKPQVNDVIDAVGKVAPGNWLPVVVARDGAEKELVAKFPSQL